MFAAFPQLVFAGDLGLKVGLEATELKQSFASEAFCQTSLKFYQYCRSFLNFRIFRFYYRSDFRERPDLNSWAVWVSLFRSIVLYACGSCSQSIISLCVRVSSAGF